jgi:hypothetical protein
MIKIRLLILKEEYKSSDMFCDYIIEIKNKKIIQIDNNNHKTINYKLGYVCKNQTNFKIYNDINITEKQCEVLLKSKDIIIIKMIIDIIKYENNII